MIGDRWTDRPDGQQSPGSEVKDSVAAPPLLSPPPSTFHSNYQRLLFPFPEQAPCTFSPSLFSLSSTLTPLYLSPLSSIFPSPLPHPFTLLSSSSSLLLPLPAVPSPLPLFFWLHPGFAHAIWGSMWFLDSRSGIPKSKFGLAAPLCVRGLQTAPLLCPRCCAFGDVAPVATGILGDRGRGRGEQAASEAGKLSPQPNVVCL